MSVFTASRTYTFCLVLVLNIMTDAEFVKLKGNKHLNIAM